jgi:putative intracellular protease/amidase
MKQAGNKVAPAVKPLPASSSSRTILLVTTSHAALGMASERTGVWLSSLASAWCSLCDAGHRVRIGALAARAVPIDSRSLSKPGGNSAEVERLLRDPQAQRQMERPTSVPRGVDQAYDAIVLPGGHGCLWDHPGSTALALALEQTLERGGHVAAVCHGVSALLAKGRHGHALARGRKLTAFSHDEETAVGLEAVVPFDLEHELRLAGALYSRQSAFMGHVVCDDNLITGQNPASAPGVMQALLARLASPTTKARHAPLHQAARS